LQLANDAHGFSRRHFDTLLCGGVIAHVQDLR
jgi:hypothetical protein